MNADRQPTCEHGLRHAECVICSPLPAWPKFHLAELEQVRAAMALLAWYADPLRSHAFDSKVSGSHDQLADDPATEPYRRELARSRQSLRRLAAQARRVIHGPSGAARERRCPHCGRFD